MSQTGIVILAHGSRGEQGIVEVPQVLRRVTEGVKALLPPEVEVIGAALQFNHPNLEEAVKSLVEQGAQRIAIMPYFLFPGRHITDDIPQLVEKLKYSYPDNKFIITNTLGSESNFIYQVVKCIEEAVPELWSNNPTPPTSPEAIEQQSMEIVERLLSPMPDLSREQLLIVKRIVHACGDPQVVSLLRFSPSAIPSGLNAINKGSPIFTDVNMVAAGINRRMAENCKCSVSCAMEEINGQKQTNEHITRAAASMHRLGKRLNDAIVAIGNAPTALMALLELIDNNEIKPALIVGMPVGFVQAKESKEELMKRDVPYITIVGTRGGSAMAVATVNALLKIAVEENEHKSFAIHK